MGNTVVLKPSQHTPLSSYWLAEAFAKAGFPKGVFNLVTGRGGEVGNVLSEHPLVNMISFTGSTAGGITVSRHALGSVKPVSYTHLFYKINYLQEKIYEAIKFY